MRRFVGLVVAAVVASTLAACTRYVDLTPALDAGAPPDDADGDAIFPDAGDAGDASGPFPDASFPVDAGPGDAPTD